MTVLRLAPWRRAPALLLRRVGVAVAVLAAVTVAALPAAAAGPFLSAGRSATLHRQIDDACGWQVGARITARLYFEDPYTGASGLPPRAGFDGAATALRRYQVADGLAAGIPGLAPATTTIVAEAFGNGVPIPMWLMSRTGAESHLQVLHGPDGAGVWINDEYAAAMHLAVGDPVTVGSVPSDPNVTPLRVAAVYRSLRQSPDVPWWCSLISYYRPPNTNAPSPQLAFLDQPTLLRLGAAERLTATQFQEYPLADPHLSIDTARRTAAGIARMRTGIATAGPFTYGDDIASGTKLASHLADFVARADLARNAMRSGVVPVTLGGLLVGLVVVAAAGAFWVRRRRTELVVLAVRGVGAGALATKAVLEVLPVVAAGALLGWLGSWLLVRWGGPDPVLSRESLPWAAGGAALAFAASVLLIAGVTGLAARRLIDGTGRASHPLLRRIPWELALFGVAVGLWGWLGGSRELADEPGGIGAVARVPGRLLIVPFVLVVGACILAARVGIVALRRTGTAAPRRPVAVLVRQRITRHAVMTAVLGAATLIPIALAVYGSTVTGSVHTTAVDEARLIVGTDVVLTLSGPAAVPPALAGSATEVVRIDSALVGGLQTDVLVVDPAQFAKVAYWDDRLGGPLARILAPTGRAGDVPTVVSSDPIAAGTTRATWRGDPILGGTVQVVTTGLLPAQQGGFPVTVVARGTPGTDIRFVEHQLWVRGDPARIRAIVGGSGLPVTRIRSVDEFYANTLWEPVTFTFGYLSALSLLTGVVTLVGMLLYLESRLPGYRRGYVLLRRMGLSAARHRRALLAELGVPLGIGLLGALALTAGLVAAFHRDFEVNRGSPPDTVLDIPYRGIGLLCGGVVVIAVVVTWHTQRRIARADPGMALRDTL